MLTNDVLCAQGLKLRCSAPFLELKRKNTVLRGSFWCVVLLYLSVFGMCQCSKVTEVVDQTQMPCNVQEEKDGECAHIASCNPGLYELVCRNVLIPDMTDKDQILSCTTITLWDASSTHYQKPCKQSIKHVCILPGRLTMATSLYRRIRKMIHELPARH